MAINDSYISNVKPGWSIRNLRVTTTDVAAAAVAIGFDTALFLMNVPDMVGSSWLAPGLFLFIGSWTLIWRHRAPLTVLAIIMLHLLMFVTLFFGGPFNPREYIYGTFVSAATPAVALAAVAAHATIRVSLPVTIVSVAYMVSLQVNISNMEDTPWVLFTGTVLGTVAWSWGWITGANRRRIEALEQERQRALAAVVTERANIANELHDIVAHAVTVMMLHAAGGRKVIEIDPARAAHALEVIESVGTEATKELARLLEVLRPKDSTKGDGLGPFPGLDEIDTLISTVKSAGVHISLVVEGDPRKLDISVDHAAYRVIQEALTNITKHAGPGTNATVTIAWGPDSLDVVVSDDGAGHSRIKGKASGYGLLGLRERVAVAGGSVRWGPQGSGFVIGATLPVTP